MNISIAETGFNTNNYSSSRAISIFTNFITLDIGGRKIDSLLNWLNEEKYESAVLNYSYIKKRGDKILIYCFYDGYEREENLERDCFEIDKANLIEVAKVWQELYPKYQYIKITEEDGKVSLHGSFERD